MSKSAYLSEEDLENLALKQLECVGYQLFKSEKYNKSNSQIDYERGKDPENSILKPRLLASLKKINPGFDKEVYKAAYKQFVRLADNPDLMINNHQLHKLIIGGAKVKISEKGQTRTLTLYPIDFKNVDNNDFVATNQFTSKYGDNNRRMDITLFINGLPLVTFELKNMDNERAGIEEAYNQLQTYKAEIPNYMQYNEILIISDGVNAQAGTLTSGFDRFMRWRAPRSNSDESELQLETMIKFMLNPRDLLNLIENFIIFETNGDETIKIIAAYHQYYMVNKAVVAAKRTLANPNDKRIGVVWHTTGSGKSLSMVFFSGIVSRKLGNPAILVLNDRNDLDGQLYHTFDKAHKYLQQNPAHADSSEEVREYMSRNSGGIVFSTIQKFSPEFENGEEHMPVLTKRSDIIVIADEAHRTQYGLEAKLTKNGLRYGYAKYLRDALPNASFIGFTGTPINLADKSTTAVFGDYIDIYDITQAVNDHATVRIYYESHVIPLKLKKGSEEKYKQLINDVGLNDNPDEPENIRRNKQFTRLEVLAGAKPRLEKVAKHFVKHFEARREQEFGKAMIVELSRQNAVRLYNEIIKLRPNWASDDIKKGKIKIVMTTSASDGPELAKFKTTKQDRGILEGRMKDNEDELSVVIVVDMWLTGFDSPNLNTMYIDKPMHGHNLVQAIARVNRVFKDKDSGLIVDYIGIADQLKLALSFYSKTDQKQVGIDVDKAFNLLKEKYEIIKEDFLYGIDYSDFDSTNSTLRIKTVTKVANEILEEDKDTQQKFLDTVTQVQKAFALVSTFESAQKLAPEIAFFIAVKTFIIKLNSAGSVPGSNSENNSKVVKYRIRQYLDQSIVSEPYVDLYKNLGIEKPSLDVISDKFLKQIQKMPEKNIAIVILRKLLEGKIRAYQRKNLVKGKKFNDMLKDAIQKYNTRGITSEIVIRELIEMAQKMNAEQEKGKDLGLSDEEIAFYDALANHEKAVQILGEEKLHLIAAELVKIVKKESGVDWQRRRNVQAKMRVAVKHLLRQYGYPPDIAPKAVDTVVTQAEKRAANDSE